MLTKTDMGRVPESPDDFRAHCVFLPAVNVSVLNQPPRDPRRDSGKSCEASEGTQVLPTLAVNNLFTDQADFRNAV